MKKLSFLLILFLLISSVFGTGAVFAYTPDFEVDCKSALLVNLDTGTVLYEKNINEKMYPASFTKIMTAVLAIEATEDLDKEMLTAPRYVFDELYGKGGSTADIYPGETMSMRDMIACLLIQSANESALIIADHISGNIPDFVDLMNQKAKELGMTGTHYSNPHGLHDEELYTTVSDMYKLVDYALKKPFFKEIVSKTRYNIGKTNKHAPRTLVTTNKLMDKINGGKYYYGSVNGVPIVNGVKTGYTIPAGHCLLSTASKDGLNFLCICMGSPTTNKDGTPITDNLAFLNTKSFYNWAFSGFAYKKIVTKNDQITEIRVNLAANKDSVILMPEKDVSAFIPKEAEATSIKTNVILKFKEVNAPVKKGDLLGEASLMLADKEIGRVNLVAGETIERNTFLYFISGIKKTFSSAWFKLGAAVLIFLCILYVSFTIRHNKRKKRKNKKLNSYHYGRYHR